MDSLKSNFGDRALAKAKSSTGGGGVQVDLESTSCPCWALVSVNRADIRGLNQVAMIGKVSEFNRDSKKSPSLLIWTSILPPDGYTILSPLIIKDLWVLYRIVSIIMSIPFGLDSVHCLHGSRPALGRHVAVVQNHLAIGVSRYISHRPHVQPAL